MVSLSFFTLSSEMLLFVLFLIELILMIDRGALSSVVTQLESDTGYGLGITFFEVGVLSSLNILGYMLGAPVSAHAAQFIHPDYLMAFGLIIWSAFLIMFSFSHNYAALVLARFFLGLGNSAFGCLSPPMVLDAAPHEKKSIWFGIYFIAVPVGTAIGFVYGTLVSSALGAWMYPFIIEAIVMLPLIFVLIFSTKDPKFYAKKRRGSEGKTIYTAFGVG